MQKSESISNRFARKARKVMESVYAGSGNLSILSYDIPMDASMGDIAFALYEVAQRDKKAPQVIAQEIVEALQKKGLPKIFSKIEAAGAYVNFFVAVSAISEELLPVILRDGSQYGAVKLSKGKAKKVMIEFSNPNTHKEFHVGHLRNVCLGDALVHLYENRGWKVTPVNYFGDWGAHVAKTLWYLDSFVSEKELREQKNKGAFLGDIYKRATEKLEEDPSFRSSADIVLQKLQNGDAYWLKLWKKTRKWSLDSFSDIYGILGVQFDALYFNSEMDRRGSEVVRELLEKGIATESEGAIIVDLSKYDLDVLVIRKSDGTTLYSTQDLGLAHEKFDRKKIDKSLIVVDTRQSLYFRQIFKILELLGYTNEHVHVPYEFVRLEGETMSSRKGNVLTFTDLYEKAMKYVTQETIARHGNEWTDKKIAKTAQGIVLAGLKFGMLKQKNTKVIDFNIKASLDVNGFTGPYIQYAYVRLRSIFKKHKQVKNPVDYSVFTETEEKPLLKLLDYYSDAIETAFMTNDPSHLAHYLYDLAHEMNRYYHAVPVLQASEPVRNARLVLLQAVSIVLENGMDILGITPIKEM